MIIKWHNAKWKSDKLYLFYEYNNKIHIYICVWYQDLKRMLKRNKQFKIYNSKCIVFSCIYYYNNYDGKNLSCKMNVSRYSEDNKTAILSNSPHEIKMKI